jgi:hypothetical protein
MTTERRRPGWLELAVLVLAAVAFGCDVGTSCTLDLRTAVIVRVTTNGQPIDAVTASRRGVEAPCMSLPVFDVPTAGAGGSPQLLIFSCSEQSPGRYGIRVRSGDRTFTQIVEVEPDEQQPECHVMSPPPEVEIEVVPP